jgi:hypothetical protein
MQSCNRFLNEYENYCIINHLLELNSPAVTDDLALYHTQSMIASNGEGNDNDA